MRRVSGTHASERSAGRRHTERVFVRVYDLGTTVLTRGVLNYVAQSYGAFHTGVEVYGREWSFGMTLDDKSSGITWNPPAQHADHTFRETLSMGYTSMSPSEVFQLIESMRNEWRGCTYRLLTRNCHHFSDAFCQKLGVSTLPPWVNTLASVGAGVARLTAGAENDQDSGEALRRVRLKKSSARASASGICPERVLVRVYAGGSEVGAFHSAVLLYGQEWSFMPAGIVQASAGQGLPSRPIETLAMGYTRFSHSQVLDVIEAMKMDWSDSTYNQRSKSCHHFADAFCQRLGALRLPPWVGMPASSRPEEGGKAAASQGFLSSIWDNTFGIFTRPSDPGSEMDACGSNAEDGRAQGAHDLGHYSDERSGYSLSPGDSAGRPVFPGPSRP